MHLTPGPVQIGSFYDVPALPSYSSLLPAQLCQSAAALASINPCWSPSLGEIPINAVYFGGIWGEEFLLLLLAALFGDSPMALGALCREMSSNSSQRRENWVHALGLRLLPD